MDSQAAIDMVVGTANLTDQLDTEAATWLLDWAAEEIPSLLYGVDDEAVAHGKVSALMAVMRKLNQIAANRSVKTPDALQEELRIFLFMYANLFTLHHSPRPGNLHHAVKTILRQTSSEMLAYLLDYAARHCNDHDDHRDH
ncbi:MAG TPA: hypothetical protein VKQ72_22885 [Aggregatilineales bacterium]|nr:hypothetical protein [Aggregatilineales bacterium]